MKIYIKNKQTNFHLIIGLVFVVLGIIAVTGKGNTHWTQYGYLVIGLVFIGGSWFQKRKPYVHIKDDILKVNNGFKTKEIDLNKIESIRKFGGDYKFNHQGEEIIINTQMIDPASLKELDSELEKYNIEWT